MAVLAASARRRRVPGPEVGLAHVAWGASEEELAALTERLPASAGVPPSAVLVVTDCDAVHLAAARGCRLEYVPRSDDWGRAFPGRSYEAFLSARGHAIAAAYRIGRVELPDGVPDALRRALEQGQEGRPGPSAPHGPG